ncbi:response regulator [Mariprofundus erugo]|uniref:histidine kinase n=1 Tax=Mariprofundus erugo TaxID=2528639 RepID=A0A5R9GW95_9PROT|nr:hybrid sensor histidine kinase/response regulator [Mariprofundus erugo]TLS69009.1 response regulator [Mariprofundus erugo]TLS74197.1 response regulator [Mariprofundus erugo]
MSRYGWRRQDVMIFGKGEGVMDALREQQQLRIRLEQVRLLFEPSRYVAFGYIVIAVMTAIIQWPVIDHRLILLWGGATVLTVAGRLWLAFAFERAQPHWCDVARWERAFFTGTVFAGLVWGIGVWLLFPAGDIVHQAVIVIVIAGMSAAGSATLSGQKAPAVVFELLILLPLMGRLLLEETFITTFFAAMVGVHLLLLLNSCLRNCRNHLQNITLRFESADREAALLAADEKLRLSEMRLARAQRMAHLGHWEYEIAANRLTWSDEIHRIFEFDSEAFEGTFEAFLDIVHPDDRQKVSDAYRQSLNDRSGYDIVHRLQFADGRIKYVHECCETTYDEEGIPLVSTGTVQDVTEHRQLEEQLLQSQKMEAIGTLVGGIAHDFNNMLAAIQGNVYLARQQLPNEAGRAAGKLDNIEKLSLRAGDMVQQLLTFARKDTVQMRPLPLNMFMKEAGKLARSTIPEDIDCTFDLCSETLTVLGDATQLQQALMNLLNNACDALQGVRHPQIECSLQRWKSHAQFHRMHPEVSDELFARIRVADNGGGIASEHLEKIFEPFFTTKGVGKGTGLGLAMVYGAVSHHGGVIEVESKPGKGTAFHIYLPIYGQRIDSHAEHAAPAEVLPGKGEKILLVDDEQSVRSAVAGVLESLGYQVVTACDGEQAVAQFLQYRDEIGLAILDVVMPKMGGMEAARQIREMHAGLPIILATGYDREKALKTGERPERALFLSKPFSVEGLSVSLRSLLDEVEAKV